MRWPRPWWPRPGPCRASSTSPTFVAEDGERVSLITFDSSAAHAAWRDDPRHRAAQRQGRDEFYERYSIQVATCDRATTWERPAG